MVMGLVYMKVLVFGGGVGLVNTAKGKQLHRIDELGNRNYRQDRRIHTEFINARSHRMGLPMKLLRTSLTPTRLTKAVYFQYCSFQTSADPSTCTPQYYRLVRRHTAGRSICDLQSPVSQLDSCLNTHMQTDVISKKKKKVAI